MRATKSIASTFTLVVSVCTILIFSVTIGSFYYRSRVALKKEMRNDAANLVLASIYRVETTLHAIGKVTEGMARSLEMGEYTDQGLAALLKDTLADNGDIHGLGAAFEPDPAFNPPTPIVPYFFRQGDRLIFDPVDSSQYPNRDWYQIPKELGRKAWSEPYFDSGGHGILMTSCSVPVFLDNGREKVVRGVVVADVSLEWLTKLMASIRVLETGYSFLLSRNGTFLTHPNRDLIMNETIFSLTESLDRPELRELGRKMVRGGSGLAAYTDLRGMRALMYYAPVPSTGWTLGVVFPEAELYADVRNLTLVVAGIALAGIVLLTAAVHWIARRVTAPLGALAEATEEIASGNFDAALPAVRSGDEVGKLTFAFAAMTGALKDYIRDLTETTAAKERIQSELNMATDIQASLLPRLFPAFPDRPEFDIHALMDPAKEVGGDFYDFFFIDDTNLCFLVADVADKGVPAALYMMVAKTLLKAEGQRLGEPDQILAGVNRILAADNDSCMFTTVFCAILDTASGEVRFANAGHNPPVLISAGRARSLPVQAGFVLGPMEDVAYTAERIVLRPGDTLFLYTDGITEARNRNEELYGQKRLLEALQAVARQELAGMIRAIRAEVARHAADAPQSDDVTMIAIRYKGPAGSA
ncbi:SpoIIE family protein phosphatase [Desulfobulbus elongatus]|uniref:SpoIIE family protein phosphatase n=1 Tax=Desulfobulbus elongatus TaxID=53332 RepID=UPI00047FE4EB|nr:SpoIIE family protein phosphatase [Desulfobulbus elongatus]